VTITVTCYSWAPSSGDHLLTCGAIFWPPHSNPRPTIIARFCSRRIRDEIFSHQHRLKEYNKTHPQERIYINESLTRTNRQCFNKCLLYRKSNNFKYIWTRNGSTYLRRNENSNTIAITKESDLVRYKIINH